MSSTEERLRDIQKRYAHWNVGGEGSFDCSPLDCNNSECHFDGSCDGDGE